MVSPEKKENLRLEGELLRILIKINEEGIFIHILKQDLAVYSIAIYWCILTPPDILRHTRFHGRKLSLGLLYQKKHINSAGRTCQETARAALRLRKSSMLRVSALLWGSMAQCFMAFRVLCTSQDGNVPLRELRRVFRR